QEGDVLGTPSYMSPEQAFGRQAEVDEQSDVWSLGAVLYEVLTGRPPFVGKNPSQTILKVQKDPVVPVKQLCPEAPPELAAVAERALQRNKKQRYRRAKQLADDIEAFQSGARVTAYEYSSLQLLQRFIKKNKTVSIISLVALLAICGALVRTWQENRKARHSLAQALLEKSDAAGRDQIWALTRCGCSTRRTAASWRAATRTTRAWSRWPSRPTVRPWCRAAPTRRCARTACRRAAMPQGAPNPPARPSPSPSRPTARKWPAPSNRWCGSSNCPACGRWR